MIFASEQARNKHYIRDIYWDIQFVRAVSYYSYYVASHSWEHHTFNTHVGEGINRE